MFQSQVKRPGYTDSLSTTYSKRHSWGYVEITHDSGAWYVNTARIVDEAVIKSDLLTVRDGTVRLGSFIRVHNTYH